MQLSRFSVIQRSNLLTAATKTPNPGFLFGGLHLPLSLATNHQLVIGSVGSGKTLTIRAMMESMLPLVGKMKDFRALILDAKGDMAQILAGMKDVDMSVVALTNPFDVRGRPWHMAKDIRTKQDARNVANILIPDKKQGDSLWVDGPRALVSAVLNLLRKTATRDTFGIPNYGLHDLLYAFRNPERLRTLLEQTEEGLDVIATFFEPEKTFKSIFVSVAANLEPLENIAVHWDHVPRERYISLRDWYAPERTNSILVLRTNASAGGTGITTLNRILFTFLSQLILDDNTETEQARTFVIMDEVNDAGNLGVNLIALAGNGRSKGCSLTIGTQSLSRVQLALGGELEGKALLGLCKNRAYLRIDDKETAEWAEGNIGSAEIWNVKVTTSTNDGPQGESSGTSTTGEEKEHRVVMASEFMNIPLGGRGKGFGGFYNNGLTGLYSKWLTQADLDPVLSEPDKQVPAFLERILDDDAIRSWNAADLNRLNLPLTFLRTQAILADNTMPQIKPPPADTTAPRNAIPAGDEKTTPINVPKSEPVPTDAPPAQPTLRTKRLRPALPHELEGH